MSVLLPVERIAAEFTPYGRFGPWGRTIRRTLVARAIWGGILQGYVSAYSKDQPAKYHAARIAYLVVHGWSDPIEIDVGCPDLLTSSLPTWPILDGNHRLAAAIYRADEFIEANVAGDLDLAYEMFGVDCAGVAA